MRPFENGDFMEKYKTGSLSKAFTKIISRYIIEINVEDKTLKIIEANSEYLCDLEMETLFLKSQTDKLRQTALINLFIQNLRKEKGSNTN